MFDSVKRRLLRLSRSRVNYPVGVHTPSAEEQAALVALLRERPRGLNWAQLTDAVLEHGSADRARLAILGEQALFAPDNTALLDEARRDIAGWRAEGMQFWTILDEAYPARVRDIQEAPPFLFARGAHREAEIAVSVVGSRDASDRGAEMASNIAKALVGMDVAVISGLARGIDTAAHTAALRAGGRTVAVIGTGISRTYPAANRELQQRIADEGLVLSQFWPDAPPQQHNFPMRNAVMSGYGIATIIVEAGEHSGARIQARMAVHHGRPVILTDLVVKQTEWGKQLLDRPDVYEAGSISDIAALVEKLVARPAELSKALSQIAV